MIYNVTNMEALIRSELNESTTLRISDTELLAAINDGYKYVATRGLCYEKESLGVTIVGRSTVKFAGIRVNYLELLGIDSYSVFTDDDMKFTDDDTTWYAVAGAQTTDRGLMCILPTAIGHTPLNGTIPQKWFNWGKYVIVEPVPDQRYVLKFYYSDYPTALALNTDELLLPKEFHRCVIDYAEAMLSIKLKRWVDVVGHYNMCAQQLQKARSEYILKRPDPRAMREIPEAVIDK